MPLPALLALSGAALAGVAFTALSGSSAGAIAGFDATASAGVAHPAADSGDANIRTVAAACRKGSGASSNPHGQDCVEVTASGFLGGEPVLVREFRRPGWQLTLQADGRGQVSYRLTPAAGHRAKDDVLTFVGLGASSPAATAGTVQLSVPRTAIYRFGGRSGS